MKMMNWVRANLPVRRQREEMSGEYEAIRFLKMQRRHDLGGLVLSHLVTNPDELPDHVLGRAATPRTVTAQGFLGTGWSLCGIAPEQQATLERLPGKPPQEQVVVLSDRSGTVLLFDVASPAEAAEVMTAAERATCATARRAEAEHPFSMSRFEFTGGQPGMRVVVGWNYHLNTHYAEVWDDTDEENYPVSRFGVRREGLDTVEDLAEVVRPYAEIPGDILGLLTEDEGDREMADEYRCHLR
jgi:hypothetical protein